MSPAPISTLGWAAVGVAWLLGAFGGGALLARLYRRLHPELDFYKLWALWTVVLSLIVALLFALA